jgi:hypothetical protein
MPFRSKSKRKKYNKEWKNKNRAKQKEYNVKWKAKLKEWYLNYKKSSPCPICGEFRVSVLEAHHVYPENKSFSLHEGVKLGISIRRLEIEASKCVIVCCLHHRLFHAGSLNEEEQERWDNMIQIFNENKGTHFFGQPPESKKDIKVKKKKGNLRIRLLDE